MHRQPIETAPHDRHILIFGTWAWESLYPSDHTDAPEWRVAEWRSALTYDEDGNAVPGFASVTCNPYTDYSLGLAWAELPPT